jgi:hypothetical protein
MTAQAIDDVLAGTFPASDPPAWNPGIARPAPAVPSRRVERAPAKDETNDVRSDVIDVSRPPDSERTFTQALVSLTGATGLVLLVPLAILAVGTPVPRGLRGVVELAGWVLAFIR